jgi:hypothetical protein
MKFGELLGAGMLVRGAARASSQAGQFMLDSLVETARERVRPKFEAADADRGKTHGAQALARLPLNEAMDRFMEFAEDCLSEWRKTAAHARPDGIAVATYTGRYSPRVTLQARSYWARIVQNDHSQRRRGGFRIQERVPYRYLVTFELRPHGVGRTLATFRTTETTDPDLSCAYDLTEHFEAPSMPGGFGRVGERFLASLPR